MNEASIPNFSLLGGLEGAQIYLPGVGGVGLKVIIRKISVQIGLNWNYQLELSLAMKEIVVTTLLPINLLQGPTPTAMPQLLPIANCTSLGTFLKIYNYLGLNKPDLIR